MSPAWDGGEVERVTVSVQRVGDPIDRKICDVNLLDRRNDLPGDCAISPAEPSDDRRLRVFVVATLRGELSPIRRELVVGFVAHTTQVVEVLLASRCRASVGVICPRDTTCGPTICEPIEASSCAAPSGQAPNFATDLHHCGGCGRVCATPQAIPACTSGVCTINRCQPGYFDLDGDPGNGCEYVCVRTEGGEVCDGRDNDCNGVVDDGFDVFSDIANCGRCANVCSVAHAAPVCRRGSCQVGACETGYRDADGDPTNGCECQPSGEDVCDGIDNDCNGVVDNGVDLMRDPLNCGSCGRACSTVHARPTCTMGRCALPMGACEVGYADLNRDPEDGCEAACGDPTTGATGPERCNGRDDDCDGLVDNGMVEGVGAACGSSSTGICRQGTNVCESGILRCTGATPPAIEVCNGLDDDCDGVPDDAPLGGALPGTGPATACGSNVGACRLGRFQCVGARIVCVGETGPSAEVCDGVDNDCDGRVDEDLTAAPAGFRCNRRGAETAGVCTGSQPFCGGTRGWTCDFPTTYRDLDQEALCDGLDNNCDGTVDEGCLRTLGTELRLDRGAAANSIQPTIVGEGRFLGVAFLDRRAGEADVFFTRSTDNGVSWLPDIRLDTDRAGAFNSVQPALAWSGVNVFAAWGDFRGPGIDPAEFRQVYFTSSMTSGATWGASDRRINARMDDDAFNLRLVVTPSGIAAVWEAIYNSLRGRHVWSAFSRDQGATWGPVVQVDSAPLTTIASTPDVAVGSGSRVYVAWRDNRNGSTDIFLRRSTDGGATWGPREVRIDTDTAGTHASEEPCVAADDVGNVYVAWQDVRAGMAYDIYFNRSSDHGATWGATDRRLDTDSFAQDSVRPTALALRGGGVSVVWEDRRWGLPVPYANRSTDAGVTWMRDDVPVVGGRPGVFRAYDIVAAATGRTVFAAWADDRNGSLDIYSNYSLDGGATFQPVDIRVDASLTSVSTSDSPVVFANDDGGPNLHVVWIDRRADNVTGDVYYRRLSR